MVGIEIRSLGKSFRSGKIFRPVFSGLDLSISPGEFVTVVGASGGGKSTLLRIIGGLMDATEGDVVIDGQRVTGPPPHLIYLFQHYSKSLFAWKTALDNVAFGVLHASDSLASRLTKKEARESAKEYLTEVDIPSDAWTKFPSQLSGGMQQRVAIARALAASPRVLLLDEPFSAVDELVREDLQQLVQRIWLREELTVIMVTHSIDEALLLGDRVVVMPSPSRPMVETIEVLATRPRRSEFLAGLEATELRLRLNSLIVQRRAPGVRHDEE